MDDEVNLLDYWRVIWKRRRLVAVVVIVAVFATAAVSLFITNIYQARAVIIPVAAKEGGGSAGLAQQFGGVPGIAMPGSASASEIVNLLKSNILREKIVRQYKLLPILFYEQWDAEKKTWKKEEGIQLNPLVYVSKLTRGFTTSEAEKRRPKKEEGVPDEWDALRLFDDIVKVNHNIKESTITLSVDFYDPDMAAKLVEYFLSTLIDHMSSEAKRVAMTNRKYLQEQLGATTDPFIKQKTYNLIAQQIETAMMAEVKENFAFKVIDPPMVPDKKIKPKRAQMVMLAFVAALFLGIFAAFFLEYLEKMKQGQVVNGK